MTLFQDLFLKNKLIIQEALRFGIVGIISTGITYGVYYLLLTHINASVAFSVAYFIAFCVNFILTTKFTFGVKVTTRRGVGFIVTNIINYVFSVGLLNFFIWIGMSNSLAPIPMFAITLLTNFFIVRWVMVYFEK